jgi:ABC-type phosphate/phosphonate transport system permease subunit
MEEPNKGLSLGDTILYAVVGVVLTYFFFTPISSFVTEAVRPSIERALGERE